MELVFMFILAFGIQMVVFARCGKLVWRLLPVLLSGLVEAAGWLCVFAVPNPAADFVGLVLSVIFLGMYLLGGTTLGWFVYGVIRAVQKLIRG